MRELEHERRERDLEQQDPDAAPAGGGHVTGLAPGERGEKSAMARHARARQK